MEVEINGEYAYGKMNLKDLLKPNKGSSEDCTAKMKLPRFVQEVEDPQKDIQITIIEQP